MKKTINLIAVGFLVLNVVPVNAQNCNSTNYLIDSTGKCIDLNFWIKREEVKKAVPFTSTESEILSGIKKKSESRDKLMRIYEQKIEIIKTNLDSGKITPDEAKLEIGKITSSMELLIDTIDFDIRAIDSLK